MNRSYNMAFASNLSKITCKALLEGFEAEVQSKVPMLLDNWFPSESITVKISFAGEFAEGTVTMNTSLEVISAIWNEMMEDEGLMSFEDASDFLGEIGNILLGQLKLYMLDQNPDLQINLTTPKEVERSVEAILNNSSEPVPSTMILRLQHPEGAIMVCYHFLTIDPKFMHLNEALADARAGDVQLFQVVPPEVAAIGSE